MQQMKIIISESCFAFLNKYHIQDTIMWKKKKPKPEPPPTQEPDSRAKYQSAAILDNQT